jgi:hypothetical protein
MEKGMNNAMSPQRALAVGLAMFTALSSPAALAQVPVIDGARVNIQTQTMGWYTTYEADSKKVRGASGSTTDSFAPGQGSGAPADCSAEGMSGETAPAASPSKRTHSQQEVAQMVKDEAVRQGVDPNFAMAIAEQESRFRQSAQSGVGALGVMQLMPGTAAELGVDPYDTRDNIRGGVKYIKKLQGMFGSNRLDLVAAAYNAGPYRQSLTNGNVPNIPETQNYVKKVTGYYNRNKAQNGDQTPQGGTEPETVGYNSGCGEQIKKAIDRNTEAQVERAKVWNDFVGKSTEANQQYVQRLQAGLMAASAGLRSSGAGNNTGFGDGSLVMAQVQCPSSVFNTGGTVCYAVPSTALTKDIQGWLTSLQEQARLKGQAATFSVMEDPALGLVTVVDNRPMAQ